MNKFFIRTLFFITFIRRRLDYANVTFDKGFNHNLSYQLSGKFQIAVISGAEKFLKIGRGALVWYIGLKLKYVG